MLAFWHEFGPSPVPALSYWQCCLTLITAYVQDSLVHELLEQLATRMSTSLLWLPKPMHCTCGRRQLQGRPCPVSLQGHDDQCPTWVWRDFRSGCFTKFSLFMGLHLSVAHGGMASHV